MADSTHRVEVVEVNLEPIPGADKVALARVFGYSCVTGKDQWGDGRLGAYLPPDSLVDVSRPEFSFLAKDAKADGKARIKAKRLRGVLSFGLLVPAPEGSKVGDDVTAALGVEHYDPAVRRPGAQKSALFTGGEVAPAPAVQAVKYDLEAGRRYAMKAFTPGEPVVVTEKLHGANGRYVFLDGQMHCGSRGEWKKEFPSYDHVTVESLLATGKVDEERAKDIVEKLRAKPAARNLWWQAMDATPTLRAFCEANPGVVVYGEVYGAVQDLRYGHKPGSVSFAAFDMMQNGQFLDAEEFFAEAKQAGLPTVPLLNDILCVQVAGLATSASIDPIPFDFDAICEMAEGPSLVPGADHVREGVVVSPLVERYDPAAGRCKLKWVGAGYLERAKDAPADAPVEVA